MNFVLIPLSVGTPDTLKSQMHIVRRSYQSHLISRDLTPLFITTLFTKEMINAAYLLSNGMLLMGGIDINPKTYNQKLHNKTERISTKLDELEITLAKKAFSDSKPILGICRGSQILNVALGGTLYKHLLDVYGVDHSVETYEELGKNKTKINILPNTNLLDIAKTKTAAVLCGHHQSVNNLGRGLRVCAQDKNGVVEAIEGVKPAQFAIGIQAHIEMQHTKFTHSVFNEFAKYVKAFA